MKYCKECGAELKDGAIYCYVCGTQYDEMAPEADAEALRDTYKRKLRAAKKREKAKQRNVALVCLIAAAMIGVLVYQLGGIARPVLPDKEASLFNTVEQKQKAEREASESRSSKTRQELQEQVAQLQGEALEKAENEIVKGYYKQAIDLLKAVQAYNQSDLKIQSLLTKATTAYEDFVRDQVQIYQENKDWDGAMTLLERAMEDLPEDAVIDQLYTTTKASKSLYQ